jgi:SAM-dependent methyltransferase
MTTADFYDQLEPFYHLIYPDWQQAIDRQGNALSDLIHGRWSMENSSILDATCGIGTQALGLAAKGFRVTASDISPQAIKRLSAEAIARGLQIDATVCDVRQLWQHHARTFDVVISCDNSLPHLSSKDDLPQAIKEIYRCTRDGGGCVITIRDYAQENLQGEQLRPYGVHKIGDKTIIAFQTWICHEDSYDVTVYFVEDDGRNPPKCHAMRGTYYPVSTDTVIKYMQEAGFQNVERLDGIFFQPVIVGQR